MFDTFALALTLAVAKPESAVVQRNGLYCGQSYLSIHDIVPSIKSKSGLIERIDRIIDASDRVVGFVYELNTGEHYAQGLPSMNVPDRRKAGIVTCSPKLLHKNRTL